MGLPTDDTSLPESTIPASALGDLGITALGGATDSALSALPVSSTPAAASTTASTAACQGNQIQGSCTQAAAYPSATPDSGPEPPVCNKVDSSEGYLMFNATRTVHAVSQYCLDLITSNVVLSASDTAPPSVFIPGAAENGGYVALNVLFDVDSCDPGTSSDNQKLDFGTWTVDSCFPYLYTNLAETCKFKESQTQRILTHMTPGAKDSTWSDYDPQRNLEGGIYGASCALWSISGLPTSPSVR